MSFGKFASFTQFLLYGKQYCTQTGWESTRAKYPKPDILDNASMNLEDQVFIITGANAGIGKEITQYLANKKATVYMLCRSPERANKAQQEIIKISNNDRVFVLICNCGLESDIRKSFDEFLKMETSRLEASRGSPHLNGLICNAGALMNEKTMTSEGVEITFATHLLFGVYLLGSLCMPILTITPNSRCIFVSSGGMYNTAFPKWDDATSTGTAKYDGNMAYAYAKRGQIILAEQWAQKYPSVKVVSCHPGWTATEAVDAAYGDQKKYLEPMRNTWQGAEGIIWLCVAPVNEIEAGAFYLDRFPSRKHIAGPFFTEGSYTKNTKEEIEKMMENLQIWSEQSTRPCPEAVQRQIALANPLTALNAVLDIPRFMGSWYVLANIPSKFEIGCTNCIENYSWNFEDSSINVFFEYVSPNGTSYSSLSMKADIVNYPSNTHWYISPRVAGFYVSLNFDYIIIDLAEDYSYVTVGVPDRSMIWIMARVKPDQENTQTEAESVFAATAAGGGGGGSAKAPSAQDIILKKAIENAVHLGYDASKILKCGWRADMNKDPYVPKKKL